MIPLRTPLAIGLAALSLGLPARGASTDKTLVAWVSLDNTTQQGGTALTVQRTDQFDGIVFGERAPGRWMAGSDFFKRTPADQQANALETADPRTLVQMAIVYHADQIALYRNGQPYAAYPAHNVGLLNAQDTVVVFGLRHEGAGSGQRLSGAIEDARIYDRALTPEEIQSLQPNRPSAFKPYAWWTFERNQKTDRMGRFPYNYLGGGAKIERGRLILPGDGEMVATPRKRTASNATPKMPAHPPPDWLTYHLLHPGPGGAMPGDPNCAFFWKGRYHLHYIYNHPAGFAFAHVSSKDLVRWKWHPTTLHPKSTGHGMFSGTGFLTKEGRPAIIYHGQGSGRNQVAFALDDRLEKWSPPIPVIPKDALGQDAKISNWDPDCWRIGDTYYALSGGGDPGLMKSTDLRHWLSLGPLLHPDYPAHLGIPRSEDISCANLFQIGQEWMLLCISHPLGCRYYLGDFKDERYLPRFHAMMSWNGNHFFAPESVLTPDGRRVMWAWLLDLPVAPCGVQSLPRELELPADGLLRIRPLRELQSLRRDPRQIDRLTVRADTVLPLAGITGNTLELEVTLQPGTAREFGLDVLTDAHGAQGVRVAIDPERKLLRVGKVEAPFDPPPGQDLTLRVFLDKNLVEVFANDRQAAVTALPYAAHHLGLAVFSTGGDLHVPTLRSWRIQSIY